MSANIHSYKDSALIPEIPIWLNCGQLVIYLNIVRNGQIKLLATNFSESLFLLRCEVIDIDNDVGGWNTRR